jgi:TrmH family RNA methyltransferase
MNQRQHPPDKQETLGWIRLLQRHRQARDARGRFWIEGVRQFVQACDAGYCFDTIVLSRVLLGSDLAEMLARRLMKAPGVQRVRVTPEEFRSLSIAERASGIGAVVRQRWTPLRQAKALPGSCWLIVEELRSAGNLGTILRTAEATGAPGLILLSRNVDLFAPAVVRASMGGLFHLRLVRSTPGEVRGWASAQGMRLVGLSPRAERVWTEANISGPVALVIGEERKGLSGALMDLCDERVRLPMTGRADSLNVAVAAGVMMYEVVRRSMARAAQLDGGATNA